MMSQDTHVDYLHCTRCNASSPVTVVELWRGGQVAFERGDTDEEELGAWAWAGGNWYCPDHAHVGLDMSQDEYERLRETGGELL